MKKTIKLPVHRPMVKDYEVEFPLYRKHDVSGERDLTIIYERVDWVDGHMRKVSVKVAKQYTAEPILSYVIEVENDYRFDRRSDINYTLGLKSYASIAEQFNEVLRDAIAFAKDLQAVKLEE